MTEAKKTWTYTVRAENHLPEDHPEHEDMEVSVTPTGAQERSKVHEAFSHFLLTLLEIHGGTVTVDVEDHGREIPGDDTTRETR